MRFKLPPQHVIRQETGYNCGPASTQNVLWAAGIEVDEQTLAREMGTHTGGTDTIDLVANVLRKRTPEDVHWKTVWLPNDPPSKDQREQLWHNVKSSIDSGWGCVLNWEAPPNNHPKAVAPSDPKKGPFYGGSTVWHYVSVLDYIEENPRRFFIVDSGFPPWTYYVTLDQCATLIPPKGYAYAVVQNRKPAPTPPPVQHGHQYPSTEEMIKQIWERTVGFG